MKMGSRGGSRGGTPGTTTGTEQEVVLLAVYVRTFYRVGGGILK